MTQPPINELHDNSTEYATPSGTLKFRKRFEGSAHIAEGHFRFGSDGLSLSSLGMGTYLGTPDAATNAQITAAAVESVSKGAINVLDTAINYRHQLSEKALGLAIRELDQKHDIHRNELFICTKAGFLSPNAEQHSSREAFHSWFQERYIDSGMISPGDIIGGMHCMAPTYLRDQINISRTNLGVKTLDLFYLHNAIESQMPEIGYEKMTEKLMDAFEALEQARAERHIRYYGLATWNCFRTMADSDEFFNLETLVKLAETAGGEDHGFRYIQVPFNLAFTEALTLEEQTIEDEPMSLFEAAPALGIHVVTNVPLLQGQLLKESKLPHFQGLSTPAQNCLQFARSQAGVLTTLVGQKSLAHVNENLQVASVPPLELSEMEDQLAKAR